MPTQRKGYPLFQDLLEIAQVAATEPQHNLHFPLFRHAGTRRPAKERARRRRETRIPLDTDAPWMGSVLTMAKLDYDEKELIVVALIAMAADAPPEAREGVQLQIASIVGKLDLRAAAHAVLSEAAAASTPTKREDVG